MKTTFNYDHYFLYEELTYCLKQLEKQYPDLMKIESLGKTTKNRDVFAVTLSKGEASEKPAYYIDGNTHAGEVTGSMVAMHTIDYFLTNYDSD